MGLGKFEQYNNRFTELTSDQLERETTTKNNFEVGFCF